MSTKYGMPYIAKFMKMYELVPELQQGTGTDTVGPI
jgi:hypothetical protein